MTVQKIKEEKTASTQSKTASRAGYQAKAERASYVHRKEGVLASEETNDRKIMVFRGNGKWWRIVGKSVVYYHCIIAPRLSRQAIVHPDDDYGQTSKYGVINIPDIKKFIEEMKALDLKVVGNGGRGFIYVELKQKVSDEEFNIMINEDREKWSIAEKMVLPTVAWPALKTQILSTLAETRTVTKKFDASLSRQLGDPMMESVLNMLKTLNLVSRGRLDPMEALLDIDDERLNLDAYVMGAMHIRVLTVDKIFKLATATMNLKRALDKEISRSEKKLSAVADAALEVAETPAEA